MRDSMIRGPPLAFDVIEWTFGGTVMCLQSGTFSGMWKWRRGLFGPTQDLHSPAKKHPFSSTFWYTYRWSTHYTDVRCYRECGSDPPPPNFCLWKNGKGGFPPEVIQSCLISLVLRCFTIEKISLIEIFPKHPRFLKGLSLLSSSVHFAFLPVLFCKY
jgi:hypothetical protein